MLLVLFLTFDSVVLIIHWLVLVMLVMVVLLSWYFCLLVLLLLIQIGLMGFDKPLVEVNPTQQLQMTNFTQFHLLQSKTCNERDDITVPSNNSTISIHSVLNPWFLFYNRCLLQKSHMFLLFRRSIE